MIMSRIFPLIYIVVAPTLAGSAMVAALIQPDYTAKMVIIAVVAGAALALPASWYVAKQISKI